MIPIILQTWYFHVSNNTYFLSWTMISPTLTSLILVLYHENRLYVPNQWISKEVRTKRITIWENMVVQFHTKLGKDSTAKSFYSHVGSSWITQEFKIKYQACKIMHRALLMFTQSDQIMHRASLMFTQSDHLLGVFFHCSAKQCKAR